MKWKNLSLLILSFLTVFLFWEIAVSLLEINQTLFPSLIKVISSFKDSNELFSDIIISLFRLLVGVSFGIIVGIIFGLITGRIAIINETAGQIVNFLRFIPPLALVPLFLLWFGIGELAKILLISWTTFFPVWISVYSGIKNIEKNYLFAAKSLGVKKLYFIKHILLHGSIEHILNGARIGIGIAFSVLIAAEMIGAYTGVGHRIFFLQSVYRADRMLSYILVLGVLGLLIDGIFIYLTKRFTFWKNET